ncbi:MAG: hypothetical protein IJM08_07905, partial [Firmicutes bacterium]|nr:hypothetical protein [Bacillota bacterium]
LKGFGDLYGFVGYNGSGVFYAFFPECSQDKLNVILEAIARQVEKYNKLNPEYGIDYTYGRAVSSVDSIFEIRELLRVAIQRMRSDNAAPAQESASGASRA